MEGAMGTFCCGFSLLFVVVLVLFSLTSVREPSCGECLVHGAGT